MRVSRVLVVGGLAAAALLLLACAVLGAVQETELSGPAVPRGGMVGAFHAA